MARAFYSDYVTHCLRFYARYDTPVFHNDVDKQNWEVCDKVVKSLNNNDKEIILSIYRKGDTIPDNIYQIAIQKGISQEGIWKLVHELEREVAIQRGIVAELK